MKELKNFNFQMAIDELRRKYNFDFVGVALAQSFKHRFEIRWAYVSGNRSERYRRIVLQSGKGVSGIVYKTGKPLLIENINESKFAEDLFNYPIVIAEGLESFGAIPLIKNNEIRGVLLAGYRTKNVFSPDFFEKLIKENAFLNDVFNNKGLVNN